MLKSKIILFKRKYPTNYFTIIYFWIIFIFWLFIWNIFKQ